MQALSAKTAMGGSLKVQAPRCAPGPPRSPQRPPSAIKGQNQAFFLVHTALCKRPRLSHSAMLGQLSPRAAGPPVL